MLSVLIPAYDFNCRPLVEALSRQADGLGAECEIVVANDASPRFQDEIRSVAALPHVRYLEQKVNQGRSRIRDFLADEARYPYLIFLDGDARMIDDAFLQRYLACCRPSCCVLGGIAYDAVLPDEAYRLHWTYGRLRESRLQERGVFTPFNFMIDKKLFNRIRFDEEIVGYGYEDALFGARLKDVAEVTFIRNPLIHAGLNDAASYLERTRQACRTLLSLSERYTSDYIASFSRLWWAYKHLRRLGLVPGAAAVFRRWAPAITRQLSGRHPRMFLLDLYKLGCLCQNSCC